VAGVAICNGLALVFFRSFFENSWPRALNREILLSLSKMRTFTGRENLGFIFLLLTIFRRIKITAKEGHERKRRPPF
jgi:hypothetical protein